MKPKSFPKSLAYSEQLNEYLAAVAEIDFFCNVGQNELDGVNRAKNWDQAVKYSLEEPYNTAYINYLQSMSNEGSIYASRLDMAKFQKQWNKNVDLVNPVLSSVVDARLKSVLKKNGVKDVVFFRLVRGTFLKELLLLAFCGEWLESRSIYSQYYFDGYCPCGYKGKYPNGKLIVF